MTDPAKSQNKTDHDAPPITGKRFDEDFKPLREDWASGEIDGREYTITRSLGSPHVLVEFNDGPTMSFSIEEMLQHAHYRTVSD